MKSVSAGNRKRVQWKRVVAQGVLLLGIMLKGSSPAWGDTGSTMAAQPVAIGPKEASAGFQPGDALRIRVPTDTTHFLDGIYLIDSRGFVFLPIVGYTRVTDYNPEEFREYLSREMVKHLGYPNVRVESLIRLSFLGGFLHPGLYYVNPNNPFWEALRIAGGPVREDGFYKLKLERSGNVVSKELLLPLQNGKTLIDMGIHSGDQIRVTARPRSTGWDIFRREVLPVLSLTIGAVATSYTMYRIFQED